MVSMKKMEKSKIFILCIMDHQNNTLIFPKQPCQNNTSSLHPIHHKKSILTNLHTLQQSCTCSNKSAFFRTNKSARKYSNKSARNKTNRNKFKRICIFSNKSVGNLTNLFTDNTTTIPCIYPYTRGRGYEKTYRKRYSIYMV